MNELHFLRPYFLLLFVPFLAWILLRIRNSKRLSIWDKICSKDLLPYVLGNSSKQQRIPYAYIFAAGSLLITALAGPSWELVSHPLLKNQSGLVVLLDLSPSMLATDVKPSRLQRALYKLTDILDLRKEGQTALIAFSADPYVVTPLTDDVATIKALLPVLEPSIMPSEGHRLEKAVEKGVELLYQAGVSNGSMLLVGAELSSNEMETAMKIAAQHGIRISVLGVGTEEGAPVLSHQGGFVKDSKGGLVVSMLAKDNMKRLAKSSGGVFTGIASDDSDARVLTDAFSGRFIGDSQEETLLSHDQWHDAGYWLVICALPFSLLLFRRGVLGALFLIFILPTTIHASFWKTSDQEAQELFQQERYEESKELFQNPDWKASANYRLGDYKEAAQLFEKNQTVEGYYNCGTAKAKAGDYQGALQSYAKALEIDPNHEDTLYNKKLIEDFLKDNQDESKSDDSQQQKDEKDKENQEQKQPPEQEEKQDQEQSPQEEEKESKEQESKNEETSEKDEQQKEIDDRWLQKVPDDPGGLLRRKFLQQHRQRKGNL